MFEWDAAGEQAPPAGDGGWPGFGSPPRQVPVEDYAWPGRPATPQAAEPDAAAQALVAAVDKLVEQDPSVLPEQVALDRARTLLAQCERLGVAVGTALLDVESRALHEREGARAVSTWLQRQAGGDGGRLSRARRLADHPILERAAATGAVGLASADTACRALDRLPTSTDDGQVEGVLVGAVWELLSKWVAGSATDGQDGDELAKVRAAVVQEAITAGLEAPLATPAERLEPSFALLAQALSPTVLAAELETLVDALEPQRLVDAEQEIYDERSFRLWRKRGGGFRSIADYTDEVGHKLQAELAARAKRRREQDEALRRAAESGTSGPEHGSVGPGCPDTFAAGSARSAGLTDEQLAHDLIDEMLDDLASVREPGAPRPAALSITAGLDAVEGRLGALPGSLLLAGKPAPISPEAVRRHGCDGFLSVVLLDALRQPVGGSGSHRHATARERRILRAIWGDYCAEAGCARTDCVPHHVDPWWRSAQTRVEDLVPFCKATHHALHDGHQVIVLRDGRRLNEFGWLEPDPPPPPPRATAPPSDLWTRPPDPYPD
ncbi:MAG TPA: hypothetical protein VNU26_09615, partial [Mycobacteriales bacterium]|nr:hypothetical protein [Mycobacteriales bacterium]